MDRVLRRPSAGRGCSPGATSPSGNVERKFSRSALERDAILRATWPGDRRLDRREVQRQDLVERRPVTRLAPEPLLLGVALDEVDALGASDR